MVVRIGTWNLENLFRPGEQAGASTHAAYQAKLAALSTVIMSQRKDHRTRVRYPQVGGDAYPRTN